MSGVFKGKAMPISIAISGIYKIDSNMLKMGAGFCYIESMEKGSKRNRKVRTDCNHLVYRIICDATGDDYIGITRMAYPRSVWRSLDRRWQKHRHHAFTEMRDYLLHEAMRKHGEEAFSYQPLFIVRGKAAAHEVERDCIAEMKPSLNMECTERKRRAGARKG